MDKGKVSGIILAAFLGCLSVANADTRVGDWRVNANNGLTEAFTVNESGSKLGLLCSSGSGSCVFYLASSISCTQRAHGIVLVNVTGGAFSLTTTCQKLDTQWLVTLNNFKLMKTTIEHERVIGFAFPLSDGEFRAIRFSLDGSTAAISQAASLASGTTDMKNAKHDVRF